MTRKKRPPAASLVRSSAAEYLTFVAATGSQQQAVEMRYEDENIWLSQKMMATLSDVTVPAINQHLKRIFADRELAPDAVIKQLLTTAADGKVNAELAKQHALTEFEKYRIVQDRLFESDFDRVVAETKRISEGAAKPAPAKPKRGKKP